MAVTFKNRKNVVLMDIKRIVTLLNLYALYKKTLMYVCMHILLIVYLTQVIKQQR